MGFPLYYLVKNATYYIALQVTTYRRISLRRNMLRSSLTLRNAIMCRTLVTFLFLLHYTNAKKRGILRSKPTVGSVCGGVCHAFPFLLQQKRHQFHSITSYDSSCPTNPAIIVSACLCGTSSYPLNSMLNTPCPCVMERKTVT